jgi:cysteine desulfurase/selenocysteine lyase
MYFDNAATTLPKPDVVYQTLDHVFRAAAANPGRSGHHLAVEAERLITQARGRIARLLNVADPERIAWAQNGTHALNLALKGFLEPGDRVLTTHLEHNAVARPLRALEQRGVRLARVPCPEGRFDPDGFVRTLRAEPPTLVVMTHASNVTGELLPVAEVARAAAALGVPLLLDAAQSAGAVPLDVTAIGAAFVAAPGHKGLFGPPGTGLLYAALPLQPLFEGGTGSRSELDRQPEELPSRFESGTQNGPGIAALGAGVQWLLETGVETIHRRELALVEGLWRGLSEISGVRLYGPPPAEERVGVLSFNLEGWEPTDVAAVLDETFDIQCRPGLHCAPWAHQALGTFPAGTVRLSPGFFNTEAEVAAVVDAVRQLAGA